MGTWKGTNPADWARKAKQQVRAVRQIAVQELANELTKTIPEGGRVPVKTGNLARSLGIAIDVPLTVKEGAVFAQQNFASVLLSLTGDETVYLGYQAAYARRMNSGFVGTDSLGRTYNQAGHGFVEAAAAKWPQIVAAATVKVQQRVG
jgi:hypothetical protein